MRSSRFSRASRTGRSSTTTRRRSSSCDETATTRRSLAPPKRFPTWDAKTRERLASAPQVWGEPIERVTALDSYGRLMLTLGQTDRALEAWQRMLDLDGMNVAQEAVVRYRVAWLLANKGERANALREAKIAAELAPDDENIRRLIGRLGS
jgi:tetratricopeptide (TPR) repeat protein